MKKNSQKFYVGFGTGTLIFCIVIIILFFIYPYYKNNHKTYNELISLGLGSHPMVTKLYQKALNKNNEVIYIYGTSETGYLTTRPGAKNYWAILDRYYGDDIIFSITGGAGNTPLMWAKDLCSLPQNTKVFYIINPIYFANGLNSVSSLENYSDRYLSKNSVKSLKNCMKDLNIQAGWEILPSQQVIDRLKDHSLSVIVSFLIKELVSETRLAWESTPNPNITNSERNKVLLGTYDNDYDEINNVASFMNAERDWASLKNSHIPENFVDSPRYQELLLLNEIAQKRNIDITYILMPPNYVLYENYGAIYPQNFSEMSNGLYSQLCQNSNCIDISDRDNAKGIFIDAMHFNSYGAKKVAIQIIEYLTDKYGIN